MTMSPSPLKNARGRILIVEDPSVFREMQSLLLRSAGYVVTTCDCPEAALAEAALHPYDVAVLNSESANLENGDFLQTLRRHRPDISIIFVAAALTLEVTRNLSQIGIAIALQRPVNPTLLVEKIDTVLGMKTTPGIARFAAAPTERSLTTHTMPVQGVSTPIANHAPAVGLGSNAPMSEVKSSLGSTDSASPFAPRYSFSPLRSETASPFTSSNTLYRPVSASSFSR